MFNLFDDIHIIGTDTPLGIEISSSILGRDACGISSLDIFESSLKGDLYNLLTHYFSNKTATLIINCVEYDAIDAAETDKDVCFIKNVLLPKYLAAISANTFDCPIVHFSSNYVFDGDKYRSFGGKFYDEFDEPNPISYYGKTKLWGEDQVKQLNHKHLIVRTSWLYGQNGNNVLNRIIAKYNAKQDIFLATDIIACPTSAKQVAYQLHSVLNHNRLGLYHISNRGTVSLYEYIHEAFVQLGLDTNKLNKVIYNSYDKFKIKQDAKRPLQAALQNKMLQIEKLDNMSYWKTPLAEYLEKNKDRLLAVSPDTEPCGSE